MKDLHGRERVGDWMLTATGGMFWPLDPREDEVLLADIACGLAMKCRYGGHVTDFYSVAQHSILVSECVPPEYQLQALLHDATEAYLGDMIRPLKYQPDLAGFRAAEDKLEPVIFAAFTIAPTPESFAAIKAVDNRILIDEQQVRPRSPAIWEGLKGLKALGIKIKPMDPRTAQREFCRRFWELRSNFR